MTSLVLPGIEPSPAEEWRVLSMRQPWLWAVIHGRKRIENRRLKWGYCGPVLLHEARGCGRGEYDVACRWMEERGLAHREGDGGLPRIPGYDELPRRGGIVARCRFVGRFEKDGVTYTFTPAGIGYHVVPPFVDMRWHMKGEQYGYVLEDVAEVPYVPIRGMLGLVRAPADIVRAAVGA